MVHLRKSNTEPIIRIYSEAKSQLEVDKLAEEFIEKIKSILRNISFFMFPALMSP